MVVTLVYCSMDDHIVHIFTKPLSEANFLKLCYFLGLQKVSIIGGVLLQFHLLNLQSDVLMGGCLNHEFYKFITSLDPLETIN